VVEQKRVTIKEISKIVGVSPTTVTKALTGKDQVSEKKRALIIKTASELGYKPNRFARALVRGELKFGIVMPKEPHEFLGYLYKGLAAALGEYADYKVKGVFEFFPDNNATQATVDALDAVMQENIDGLIFAPGFGYEAYIGRMREVIEEKKIPVVFISQEMPPLKGIAFIISNAKVMGQLAAQLFSLSLPPGSEVAVITTSHSYAFHREIIEGFTQPDSGFVVKAVVENYDNSDLSYKRTKELLEQYPCLKGIYVTSYNFVSVCRCLADCGRSDIAVIGHDLYPEMERCMLDGQLKASIYQNPFYQGRTAVKVLYEHLTEKKHAGDIIIKPELVMKSNLECYKKDY
jgi:LacI family transcriptional regulator